MRIALSYYQSSLCAHQRLCASMLRDFNALRTQKIHLDHMHRPNKIQMNSSSATALPLCLDYN